MTITQLIIEINRMIAENGDPVALCNLGAALQVKGQDAIDKAVKLVLEKHGRAA